MVNVLLQPEPGLARFLRPFAACLDARLRETFVAYVAALLLEHRRLSVQSLWEHAPLSNYQRLQYFVSEAAWDPNVLNRCRLRCPGEVAAGLGPGRRARPRRHGLSQTLREKDRGRSLPILPASQADRAL